MSFGNNTVPETGIGVKKANVREMLSKAEFERRVLDIVHSKRDIAWWAENFFYILKIGVGLEKITLYPKQREMLRFLADNNRIITLAARQTGKTTTYTIFCLWLATLFHDKKILICANKLQTAIEIMDRIRRAYEQLPYNIKPGIISYNKGEVTFANGSSIRAFSTSSSGARGSSGDVLIIDEMAFIPKNVMDDFFASVMPIVSSSKTSKVIIVSTPNGANGLYYDLWQQANSKEAEKNKDGWKPFRIYWWETGGIRDEQWKQQQIATIGADRWKQEFECDFLTSATKKLIPDDITDKFRQMLAEYKLKGLTGKKCKIMSEQEDKLYEFTMWHEFDKTRTYVATGDIAEGVGGDSSVLYVWDITDLRNITMCAKFDSNSVSVVEFAFIISKILSLYGNPYFIAERNGCSSGTLDSLRITYKYPRMVTEGKNGEPGVFSHVTVKGKTCLWAREMLMTQGFGFTIYDKDLLDEWTTFVKKDNKGVHVVYQALPPAHDDCIMAFIWLCYILQSDIIEKYFWVGSTFTSQYGNVYAQIVKPQKEYTIEEVKAATDDPIYRDFLDFKEELLNKFGHAIELEKADADKPDMYGFRQQDRYFGGYDFEPSWNGPQFEIPVQQDLNPNNVAPSFFIGGFGGFSC